MYKSPIEIITGEMEMHMEGAVLKAVQNVGIQVDKEELLRALKYDREQYRKGYAAAREEVLDEFVRRLEQHEFDNWTDHHVYGITWSDIELIIKQMKGESHG